MYISSNEVPSQNQLAIGGVAQKLYIHTQALEFYQCGTTPLSYSNIAYIHSLLYFVLTLLPSPAPTTQGKQVKRIEGILHPLYKKRKEIEKKAVLSFADST